MASVAVAALPVQEPDEPDALPVKAPIKLVAVTLPVILTLPVPVISLVLRSKLPPN